MLDLEEALKRDKARWNRVMESCKKHQRKTREVFRKATNYIREQNEEKYQKAMNPKTSEVKRQLILSEFEIEALLLAIIGEKDPNNPLIRHRRRR